jgi:uncharacterized membrane protein
MSPDNWARVHGGATHFPLALVAVSVLFDAAGFFCPASPRRDAWHAAGRHCLWLGTLGAVGAVASGVGMTKGEMWGHGLELWHHRFVWPSFALLGGLAAWRWRAGMEVPRRRLALYLGAAGLAALLLLIAGYFGGELMMAG